MRLVLADNYSALIESCEGEINAIDISHKACRENPNVMYSLNTK
jgi:hypothetical protein